MAEYYGAPNDFRNYLEHYGVKGMKWRNRKHPDSFYETKGGLSQRGYRTKAAKSRYDEDSAYNKTDESQIIDARQRASRYAKNNSVERQLKSNPGSNAKLKSGQGTGAKRTGVQNLAIAARNYLIDQANTATAENRGTKTERQRRPKPRSKTSLRGRGSLRSVPARFNGEQAVADYNMKGNSIRLRRKRR